MECILDPTIPLSILARGKKKVGHEDFNIDSEFESESKRRQVNAKQRDHALRSRSTISPPQTSILHGMIPLTVPSTWHGLGLMLST